MRQLRNGRWVLLLPRGSWGAGAGSCWRTEEADPKCVLSQLPPLGTGHVRFKIPGPKGLNTLRQVLNEEPVGPGSREGLENTAV